MARKAAPIVSVTDHVVGTSFSVYSVDEIRKLSVKHLVMATAFDQLGHPVVGCVASRPPRPPVAPVTRLRVCFSHAVDCMTLHWVPWKPVGCARPAG